MESVVITVSKRDLQAAVEQAVSESIKNLLPGHDNVAPKEWLTNREAIEFLGVSKATLQRLRSDKKIAYSKVDGLIFYRRSDILDFLEAHRR